MENEFYTETPEDIQKIVENSLNVILQNWNPSTFEQDANPRDWLRPIVENYVNSALAEKYPKYEHLDLQKLLIDSTDLWMKHLLSFRAIVGMQPIIGPLNIVNRLLDMSTVECGTRNSSVGLSSELICDMAFYHNHPNFDIYEEVTKAIAAELAVLTFSEIIENISRIAKSNNPTKINLIPHENNPQSIIAERIVNRILSEAENIAHSTNGPTGNFVIVHPSVASIMQLDRRVTPLQHKENFSLSEFGKIGQIENYVKVFVSYQLTDKILIGFNESYLDIETNLLEDGSQVVCRSQTGYIYSPSKLLLDYSDHTKRCNFSMVYANHVDARDGPNNYKNFYRMIELENANVQ